MAGKKENRTLFFETPQDKQRVFENPALVMFSEGKEIERWTNTQPFYFYPFSWLDYLNKEGIRELYIYGCSINLAKKSISSFDSGKVHFEQPDGQLIKFAKERGHKVSVICNIEDLLPGQIEELSVSDFVRIRINNPSIDLKVLGGLPKDPLLSCIKLYVGDGCDYRNIALQIRDMGFDFLYVAKRLMTDQENPKVSEEEKENIRYLQELKTDQFRIVIPSLLEEKFARKFLITPGLGNVPSCDFSIYRKVLKGNGYYPCYTQQILAQTRLTIEGLENNPGNCLDCACIYENDMLHDIKTKMRRYKNPIFALEYIENGKQ